MEAGTDVAAGEPMGDVAPEDDMTIDDRQLGRETIHLDNKNRKYEESSLSQH